MIEQLQEEKAENARRRKRIYIQRFREAAHDRLMQDYFVDDANFIGYYFRHRFRLTKSLFFRLVNDVTAACPFFQQCRDARGTIGFTHIQKCTASLCQLAYVTCPDALEENLRMSERTTRTSLHKFWKYVMRLYGLRYLRKPTCSDIQQLYAHHSNMHNFPGTLGSLDFLHWAWGCCLNAYKGQYTRGDHGYPTIILEVVAS